MFDDLPGECFNLNLSSTHPNEKERHAGLMLRLVSIDPISGTQQRILLPSNDHFSSCDKSPWAKELGFRRNQSLVSNFPQFRKSDRPSFLSFCAFLEVVTRLIKVLECDFAIWRKLDSPDK